jgi:uncharacterized membrane protein YfcA
MPLQYLWLLPLGLVVGAFGTLIGAGGGFILVPTLLLLYPNEKTELITGISLAVVFFNALSGSLAYSRMKRVDYKSGIIFSLATIPGAIFGAIATAYIPRRAFDLTFGTLMIVGSALLVLSTRRPRAALQSRDETRRSATQQPGWTAREFVDALGARYRYAYNPMVGILLSGLIGFISSLLGVGGGFIHVPVLTRLLNFPVRVATATSQFVLAVMALTGTLVHIVNGVFVHGVRRTLILAVGVVIGAQFGAALSNHVRGRMIIRGLAAGLALVGLRLILSEY